MEQLNKTQIDSFLKCLLEIDDLNYAVLHNNQREISDYRQINQHDQERAQYNALIAKVTAMVVLFCTTVICSAIPFLLNRYFKWTNEFGKSTKSTAIIINCILYFGGGVLLSTTFLHLLPEVKEVIENLERCEKLPKLSFSLAEMLMCTGFFLMYLIEEIIHRYLHTINSNSNQYRGDAFVRSHSIRNSHLMKNVFKEQNKNKNKNENENENKNLNQRNIDNYVSEQSIKNYAYQNSKSCQNTRTDINQQSRQHGHSHVHSYADNETNVDLVTSSLRGLLIVLALSLHELFEGLAIGLEFSAGTVWFMFAAVSAHKLILAFCVGVELITAQTRKFLTIIYIFTFAVVSPIGIGIGILIMHEDNGTAVSVPSISSAVLQGLACGTLLYVVFFEILLKNHSGLKTYFAVLFGFVLMFGIQQLGVVGQHTHNHFIGSDNSNHEHLLKADRNKFHDQEPGGIFTDQLKILRKASDRLIYENNNINN